MSVKGWKYNKEPLSHGVGQDRISTPRQICLSFLPPLEHFSSNYDGFLIAQCCIIHNIIEKEENFDENKCENSVFHDLNKDRPKFWKLSFL